jgi:hypothetical protein
MSAVHTIYIPENWKNLKLEFKTKSNKIITNESSTELKNIIIRKEPTIQSPIKSILNNDSTIKRSKLKRVCTIS